MRDDFPAAAALFAECFTAADVSRKTSSPRCSGLPWGPSPAGPTIRSRKSANSSADNLPADSPYHVIQGGTAESVQKLTAEDLRQYHAKYFVPNNMVVTVFGDIDPDEALALVKKQFGGLKPAADFQPLSFDRSNAIAKTIVRHKTIGKDDGHGDVRLSDGEHFRQKGLCGDDGVGGRHGGLPVSGRMAAQRASRRGAGLLRPRLAR